MFTVPLLMRYPLMPTGVEHKREAAKTEAESVHALPSDAYGR